MKYRISAELKRLHFKPSHIWKMPQYLNGFLVKLPNYNSKTFNEFQLIMQEYCDMGYFMPEFKGAEQIDYRLTLNGYNELVLK